MQSEKKMLTIIYVDRCIVESRSAYGQAAFDVSFWITNDHTVKGRMANAVDAANYARYTHRAGKCKATKQRNSSKKTEQDWTAGEWVSEREQILYTKKAADSVNRTERESSVRFKFLDYACVQTFRSMFLVVFWFFIGLFRLIRSLAEVGWERERARTPLSTSQQGANAKTIIPLLDSPMIAYISH